MLRPHVPLVVLNQRVTASAKVWARPSPVVPIARAVSCSSVSRAARAPKRVLRIPSQFAYDAHQRINLVLAAARIHHAGPQRVVAPHLRARKPMAATVGT